MSELQHYVACLDLTGKRVVLIGNSQQKVEALRAAGADVVVRDLSELLREDAP